MDKIQLVCIILLFAFLPRSLAAQSYKITPWANYKKAAVTVTFDDNTKGQFTYAVPVMNEKNIMATFFINAQSMNWSLAEEAISTGHEIGNHTYSHVNLLKLDTSGMNEEIRAGYEIIKEKVPSQHFISFAYPGGQGRGSTPKDDTVRMFVKRYHINGRGIRTAGLDIGNKGFDKYDEYLNPLYDDYYYQTGTFSLSGSTTNNEFKNTLNDAITHGGWFTPLYHGVETGGISIVSLAKFTAQMDLIKNKSEECWITTYGRATCYHKERQAAKLTELLHSEDKWVLDLTDTLDNNLYKEPLTIRLFIPDSIEVKNIEQNKVEIAQHLKGDTLQFNVVPDGGDIIIHLVPEPPLSPTEFSANVLSPTEILLTWKSNSFNITKFILERSTTPDGLGGILTTKHLEEGVNTYIDKELTPTTYYYYRLRAISNFGESDWTERIVVKTQELCYPPAELSSDNITTNSATVRWAESLLAEDYNVYFKNIDDPESQEVIINSNKKTHANISELLPGTRYEWAVKTICNNNSINNSIFSASAVFTTLSEPTITSINDQPDFHIKIFPIPSTGIIKISIKGKAGENIILVIYNYLGDKIYFQEEKWDNNQTIDLSNMGGKLFIAKIITEGKTFTKQILLE